MRKVLTIAGSDPSGGAGLQADLKTFAAHHCYGMAVPVALTAQNTQGVQGVLGVDPAFVAAQLQSIAADIRPDAIKLGMLFSRPIMEAVLAFLQSLPGIPVVADPVMVATSGDRLLLTEAEAFLKEQLLPAATLITPNRAEAEVLWGQPIATPAQATEAAQALASRLGVAVLLKGGHPAEAETEMATDLLALPDGTVQTFSLPRLATPHTHGTGCTLSAALACRLAEGHTLPQATQLAKAYLHRALAAGQYLGIGKGRGPVWHQV